MIVARYSLMLPPQAITHFIALASKDFLLALAAMQLVRISRRAEAWSCASPATRD
jgi:hypothetical protein